MLNLKSQRRVQNRLELWNRKKKKRKKSKRQERIFLLGLNNHEEKNKQRYFGGQNLDLKRKADEQEFGKGGGNC